MKESLNNLITNVQIIENDHLKAIEIKRILKVIDSYEMEDYQLYYLKGCLWNLFPFDSKERENEVEFNLKKSISLKEDYIYSKTELSYFYYDKKKFLDVISLLDSIDLPYFEEKGQLWKSLKLQELLLTSKLYHCDKLDENLYNDFLGLISSYMYLPDEELTIPVELVNAILENKNKLGISPIINQVNLLINSNKQKDYFDYNLRNKFKNLVNNHDEMS